jgi:hypothetical protein
MDRGQVLVDLLSWIARDRVDSTLFELIVTEVDPRRCSSFGEPIDSLEVRNSANSLCPSMIHNQRVYRHLRSFKYKGHHLSICAPLGGFRDINVYYCILMYQCSRTESEKSRMINPGYRRMVFVWCTVSDLDVASC